jgi:para-aminobenzoate synthetase component 1
VPPTPSFPVPAGPALRRIRLPDWVDPAVAFAELYSGSGYAVWLDAGADATTGVSYLAGAHERSWVVTADARAGTVTRFRPAAAGSAVTTRGSVFDVLRADVHSAVVHSAAALSAADSEDRPDTVDADDVAFRLGWIGWLGYGLARPAGEPDPGATTQDVGHAIPPEAARAPDAALLQVDRALAFDHAARTVTLLVQAGAEEPDSAADRRADRDTDLAELDGWVTDTSRRLAEAGRRAPSRGTGGPGGAGGAGVAVSAEATVPGDAPATRPRVHWRHGAEQYARLIHRCQDRIAAGDAYQLCLTNEVTVAGRFDPLDVYRRLRASSATHHGGLLRFGAHALLSASPEEFLAVSSAGRVRTRPIKGTRPRADDPDDDRMLRDELLASDKERAENLMIVDLMRNDLGRVAALGSVAVTGLLQVESYPHVHQLVSTIEARLAPGVTAVDAVEASFPAGSMTGAPKASAMEILRELEGGDRGVYAGAFGYLGADGALDLAMVIRSVVLGPGGASIGTGGGITALSVAEEEIEETRIKAAALIEAVLASAPGPDKPVARV